MELTVQTSPFQYLRCAVQEVHVQEETADTNVPDSYPDIAELAGAFAQVILRGKDLRAGSVTVAGGIKGSILYTPEQENAPRYLEVYIPFTVKFDDPALTEQSQILCSLAVRSVDARLLNSRKASLRVSIGCQLTAFDSVTEELCQPVVEGTGLQTRYETYQLSLPLETGEKSFLIQESLELTGRPAVAQVCKLQCQLLGGEQKLVANKAVFKGSLLCRLLYLAEDGSLQSHQQSFPYSQYCALEQDYDGESVQLLPVITGYDWELSPAGESQSLELSVHVLAQCLVCGEREVRLLADAYSTRADFQPQWKSYGFGCCLDRPCTTQMVRKQVPGAVSEVLDTDVYWDYPVVSRQQETVQVRVPVTMEVLLRDEEQRLCQRKLSGEAVEEFTLAADCRCHAWTQPTGEEYTTYLGSGAEVRSSIQICADCQGEEQLSAICGGTIEETGQQQGSAAIWVRTVPAETSLWELAKSCRTTREEIMAANHLTGDCLEEDTLLLVPVF